MNQQSKQRDQVRRDREAERLRGVADKPSATIVIELGGERAAIIAKIRKANETPERTILRLIDDARPKDLDLGVPV
jgi:hypothetical protein